MDKIYKLKPEGPSDSGPLLLINKEAFDDLSVPCSTRKAIVDLSNAEEEEVQDDFYVFHFSREENLSSTVTLKDLLSGGSLRLFSALFLLREIGFKNAESSS